MQFFWHEGGPDFKLGRSKKYCHGGGPELIVFVFWAPVPLRNAMFHDFLMQDTSWETETRERKLLWSQNIPFLLSVPAVDI